MADKLTDDHVNEIRTIFEFFDTSGTADGSISPEEMKNFLNRMGLYPSKTELHEMFQLFDSNGTGNIDFPEFLSLMTRDIEKVYTPDNQVLKDAFSLFDRNGDGIVTKQELIEVLTVMGVKNLTPKEMD